MSRFGPIQFMLVGFVLLVLGVALPFLMVLKIVESTLFMGFFSYLASFGGLILGLVGLISYSQSHQRDND